MERTKRSTYAFKVGLRGGSLIGVMPAERRSPSKCFGEQRIAVVDQEAFGAQEAVEVVDERAAGADHPIAIWAIGKARNLDAASREINNEEYMEARRVQILRRREFSQDLGAISVPSRQARARTHAMGAHRSLWS